MLMLESVWSNENQTDDRQSDQNRLLDLKQIGADKEIERKRRRLSEREKN